MRHLAKNATALILAAIAVAICCGPVGAQSPVGFDQASWIWYTGSAESLGSMPAGVGFFRAETNIPETPPIRSAEVIVTCDNMFVLYLNGRPIGESEANNNAWGAPKRWDLTDMVVPGRVVLAVEAVNTLPGPAGLIVKFVVELADGQQITLASDQTWKCHYKHVANWQQPDFDDQKWPAARVMAPYGGGPWKQPVAGPAQRGGTPIGQVARVAQEALQQAARQGHVGAVVEETPGDDFVWPAAIVFVGDDCSLYRPAGGTGTAADSLSVTIFNPRKSRTFPEHDLPAPMKVGRRLYAIKPARPGVAPRVLLDAGRGALGSPSVAFDGRSILVSMALDGDPFFHIYRLPAEGGVPQKLTDGPFHDIDPAELPDGRIVFTSTRVGTFEEYHNPPSRSLFVMDADGSAIKPLTHTIIFDNEPEVLADGRIVFIRSDNFFDRGKVETLLHAVHTDGSEGYTEFGLENGPEYGGRLRSYLCGSPAPMPDGRLAYLSGPGITIGTLGCKSNQLLHYSIEAGDVAALPDGRLLCTTPHREGKTFDYRKIGILDPAAQPPTHTLLHESPAGALHSPVYLGPRARPPRLAERIDHDRAGDVQATGVLYCGNARFTLNTTAGWQHVRAIRVIAGKGLTTRSSHSYIVHAGNETIELGTVPLAPDGSFHIEVPADTPIALQAVDAEGRSELNEMSWIYVRPGERRGCVGCHHSRQATPLDRGVYPLALNTPAVPLLGDGQPHRFRGNNAAVTGMMNMQFDRYREVAGINRFEVDDAPLATGAEQVAALVEQLDSDDAGVRLSAVNRLSIYRDAAAAPSLATRLYDDDRRVRIAAAMTLAACGTRDSAPALLDVLTDPEPLVGQAAAVALENLTGHAEPFDPFAGEVQREQQALAWNAWFADTSWQRIEQELVARLASDDRDVVRRAAVALGHTGGDAARAALRKYVATQRSNNPLPEWRKHHQGDGARFNSLAAVNPRTVQAATRALGYLGDAEAVPLLAETLRMHGQPATGNLFLAEAAVEALGRIGTPEAQDALVEAFAGLRDYPEYTYWYGDHSALMACHSSPVHFFIAEALDRLGSTRGERILPHLIRSVPVDPDRALLLPNDDYEIVIGRVIRRHDAEARVVETCLAILGDAQATADESIEQAVATVHRCWAGHPDRENRAAQVLSLVCRDPQYEPRVRAAFERYRALENTIPRVFDKGIPVVLELPAKHWVCFYLARALGNLGDAQSVDSLIASLVDAPTEAATGRPDPLGPGVLFIHNDLTPCWRAAAAWALGRIGDRRAVPAMLAVIGDLENATDTRHAAAEALGQIADPTTVAALRRLAADYPEVSTRRALLRSAAVIAPPARTAAVK